MKLAMAMAMIVAAGCGGKATPGNDPEISSQPHDMRHNPAGAQGQMAGSSEHDEMAAMPPQIGKFHDTLAPRWHAAHGPQRMTDACAALAQFHGDAAAIVAAPAPSAATAAAWAEGGKQLAEAVNGLDAPCTAHDAAAFEPAFAKVHQSFHHVMEAAAEHGQH